MSKNSNPPFLTAYNVIFISILGAFIYVLRGIFKAKINLPYSTEIFTGVFIFVVITIYISNRSYGYLRRVYSVELARKFDDHYSIGNVRSAGSCLFSLAMRERFSIRVIGCAIKMLIFGVNTKQDYASIAPYVIKILQSFPAATAQVRQIHFLYYASKILVICAILKVILIVTDLIFPA